MNEWATEEWREAALCRQTDPEAFFPEKGGSTRAAKRVCSRCEVTAECLEYSLANHVTHGVWGGMTAQARMRLMDQRAGRPQRAECAHGHSWRDPTNYHIRPDGSRVCRVCERLRKRDRKEAA